MAFALPVCACVTRVKAGKQVHALGRRGFQKSQSSPSQPGPKRVEFLCVTKSRIVRSGCTASSPSAAIQPTSKNQSWLPSPCAYRQRQLQKMATATYHSYHATAVKNVHRVIRNGIDSIIKNIPTFPADDVQNFKGYVKSIVEFIESHHGHEDDFTFPVVGKRFDITKLETDHKELTPLLESINAILKADGAELAREEMGRWFSKLKELLFPHMDMEEEKMTALWLRENIDEKVRLLNSRPLTYGYVQKQELKESDDKIMEHVKKEDGTIGLPVIRYHLPP
ncbi:hypothetical protein HDU96_005883, partial [Phlyctochytrium bullatum]